MPAVELRRSGGPAAAQRGGFSVCESVFFCVLTFCVLCFSVLFPISRSVTPSTLTLASESSSWLSAHPISAVDNTTLGAPTRSRRRHTLPIETLWRPDRKVENTMGIAVMGCSTTGKTQQGVNDMQLAQGKCPS